MQEEKPCKHCGGVFIKTSRNQHYCSKECREAARRIRRGKRQTGELILKTCLECGKLFKEDKHRHTYCSAKCRTIAKRKRERKRYRDKYQHKCWSCGNYAICPWSQSKIPVKGWNAEPVQRKHKGKDSGISYKVLSCPQYIPDKSNN